MLKEERKTNDFKRVHNRSTNPLYNDHIARYYQRIRKGFKKWIIQTPSRPLLRWPRNDQSLKSLKTEAFVWNCHDTTDHQNFQTDLFCKPNYH